MVSMLSSSIGLIVLSPTSIFKIKGILQVAIIHS